jgi:hypothetical protein
MKSKLFFAGHFSAGTSVLHIDAKDFTEGIWGLPSSALLCSTATSPAMFTDHRQKDIRRKMDPSSLFAGHFSAGPVC